MILSYGTMRVQLCRKPSGTAGLTSCGHAMYFLALQVTSPSGKAIFKLDMFQTAGAHSFVDVIVCRAPEPNNLPLSDGTVTCYRNATFIW